MRQHNNRAVLYLLPLTLLPLALLPLAGCGGATGSGAGSSLTNTTGRAALDVYVTDAFSDQYKQVLATLYKIELTADGTNYITVFSSNTGQTLDLASLASTSALLASVTVPTGTYTQARITFGDHFTLVSNSGTSTSVAVASTIGTQANGQVAIVVNTPTKVQANQTNTVFIDFKLAEFQITGNTLAPSIGCGAGTPGQMGRQRMGHLTGTVANLNGTTSFTLQETNGRTVTVALTSTTTITSGQTGTTTPLANGQSVIVEGSYDPTTSTVTATSVTLNDYTTINHAEARGTVASVDATGLTFVLTVQRAEGISPTGGTITVVTNANTQFGKGRYQQGAFTDVAVGSTVAVNGVFNTTTQTLTANFVGLH